MRQADLFQKMTDLARAGQPFVLATVVEADGSTPRKAGAKMLILPDGSTYDTIGGGKSELEVIKEALSALDEGSGKLLHYALRSSGEHALGTLCGGDVHIYLDVNKPPETLVIAGAGHIAQKLAPMASLADFRVAVVDSREEFAQAQLLPEADEVVCADPGRLNELFIIDRNTYVVIVTHGHVHDTAALTAALLGDPAYVGMIGSRTKIRKLLTDLSNQGVPADSLARVHAPIGLDLGGSKPVEIAVSILAEIIAHQHGTLGKLRECTNPVFEG